MTKTSLIIALSAVVVIILCLIITFIIIVFGIPNQAEHLYGEASSGISQTQRLILSAKLLINNETLTQQISDGPPQTFEVVYGDTSAEIVGRLQKQGLISNADAVLDYMVFKGIDTTLQAGVYELSTEMSPIQISETLQNATAEEITFTILAGWRLEEIAESLPTSGLSITSDEFLASTASPPPGAQISNYLPSDKSLEGFLSPGSYKLPRETSSDELIIFLTNKFIGQLDSEILDRLHDQGLDLFQALTLASIIEREAVVSDEMPQIASVFLNRLRVGMKLESDPTVQYALGFDEINQNWWKNPLTHQDLQFNSQFNTYLYPGLTPGPISNPSYEALQAVANPAVTPFYFFRAKCDGSGEHQFAETFSEHLENACP